MQAAVTASCQRTSEGRQVLGGRLALRGRGPGTLRQWFGRREASWTTETSLCEASTAGAWTLPAGCFSEAARGPAAATTAVTSNMRILPTATLPMVRSRTTLQCSTSPRLPTPPLLLLLFLLVCPSPAVRPAPLPAHDFPCHHRDRPTPKPLTVGVTATARCRCRDRFDWRRQ